MKKTQQKVGMNPEQTSVKTGQSVSAAAARGQTTTTTEPNISRTSKGMRIKHRELYDGHIPGSTNFTVYEIAQLQPGLKDTFSWLSTQAINWEQYRVHEMSIEYIPIVGSNTIGDIILSPDYSSNPGRIPATEAGAVNNLGAVTNNVWNPHTMKLDVAAMMGLGPRRFTRDVATAGDIKTFDVGQVFICTNNCANANAIGKIFISYDIEFYVPVVNNDDDLTINPQATLYLGQASNQTFVDNTGNTAYFVYYDNTITRDPLGIIANSPSPAFGQYVPPAGSYRMSGVFNFQDTAVVPEDVVISIDLFIGGVLQIDYPDPDYSFVAGQSLIVPFDYVFDCNGSQAVGMAFSYISAVGPINARQNQGWLAFSLA
jgi:hypothetical protein